MGLLMENIIVFPTKSIRDWVIVERSMRDAFATANIPEQVHKTVIERMKSFWNILDFDLNLSFDVNLSDPYLPQMTDNIRIVLKEQINAFTSRLFLERFMREIDACHELGLL